MTIHLTPNDRATRLMPAVTTQKSLPTHEKDRRGVNTVALFDNRRDAKRASDRLSDVEKAKRLESALRQRQQQADKAAHLAAMHGLRFR